MPSWRSPAFPEKTLASMMFLAIVPATVLPTRTAPRNSRRVARICEERDERCGRGRERASQDERCERGRERASQRRCCDG
jgi:hypothetical protein